MSPARAAGTPRSKERGSPTILTHPLDIIAARSFSAQGIRHGFFTRVGGVSDGIYASLNTGQGSADAPEAVTENRHRVALAMGVSSEQLVTMHQTHSADVAVVEAPFATPPRVDGLVTKTPGLALGVMTADCAPVLFADVTAGVVGVAHAGWRGANGGVVEATVAAMVTLGATRQHIACAIGPTIAQASYEVGPEFAAVVLSETQSAGELFVPGERAGRQLFDLPGYVARRARAAGLVSIEDLAIDTYADPKRFFSYRRATHLGEPDYGRMLSAIMLEG